MACHARISVSIPHNDNGFAFCFFGGGEVSLFLITACAGVVYTAHMPAYRRLQYDEYDTCDRIILMRQPAWRRRAFGWASATRIAARSRSGRSHMPYLTTHDSQSDLLYTIRQDDRILAAARQETCFAISLPPANRSAVKLSAAAGSACGLRSKSRFGAL